MSSWTPHIFRKHALRKGCPSDFVDALVTYGNELCSKNLPVIFTLRHLSELTGVNFTFLQKVVRRKEEFYRVFNLQKKNKKSYRQIAVPEPSLAVVQRWIHSEVLLKIKPHSSSKAFATNCSPLGNASSHTEARWLVKIDITDFFEAVSERQVYKVFRAAGYRSLLAFQLTRICTRISPYSKKYQSKRWLTNGKMLGHLPQGAPTSPMLANLVCLALDERLEAVATQKGCTYTRYADDMVFSTSDSDFSRSIAKELISVVSKLLGDMGFVRNRRKTQICPPGARKIVTGLLVDHEKPRLTKDFCSGLELHLYHAKKWGIDSHCQRRRFRSLLGFRAHLHGLITYAEHIEPVYGAMCRKRFDLLPWGDLSEFTLM